MAAGKLLTRNVQPLAHDSEDDDLVTDDNISREEAEAGYSIAGLTNEESSSEEEDETDGSDGDDQSNEKEESEADVHQKLNVVSFGALKQAHDSLSKKRKRNEDSTEDKEAKLDALRKRLRSIKQDKPVMTSAERAKRHPGRESTTKTGRNRAGEDEDESASDSSDGSDEGHAKRGKHAPAEQSSKYQVTRRRQVVPMAKSTARDPRFDALRQRSNNTANEQRAYAFLQDYQKDEIQQLKSAMKLAKSQDEKDTLRRQINAMENRLSAKAAKEREHQIVRQHRKDEGEQIRQGKNPYYLKRSEVKERAMVEKFGAMKGKDREKLMERRRKKASQKEKKRMPSNRRAVD